MALNRKDCIRKQRLTTKGGTFYYKYFYQCKDCRAEITSQHHYLKKHSGLCASCSHKGLPRIAAYNSLLNNTHATKVDVQLTYDEFINICSIPDCHYCGQLIPRTSKRGQKGYKGYFIDRKDNNKSYILDNCVPCCWSCNQIKGNRFTYEEFLLLSPVLKQIHEARKLQ